MYKEVMDRERLRKIGFGLGCLGLFVVFAPGILLFALLAEGSERTVYERKTSPDGWHDARVQFDDAGAISTFSRLVFVKHRSNLSDEPLLSCRAFWGEGEEAVHLRWLDDSTLLILHKFPQKDIQAIADHCGPVRIVVQRAQ